MKHSFATSVLALGTLIAASFTACSSKPSDKSAGDASVGADTLAFATTAVADSASTAKGNKAVCRITLAVPTSGPKMLVDSIDAWVANALNTNGFQTYGRPTTSAPEAMSAVMDSARVLLAEVDGWGLEYPMTLEYTWDIKPVYVTDTLVSYSCFTYAFVGGAHGGSTFWARTFSSPDGEQLTWNSFNPGYEANLTPMVKKALMEQYFKTDNADDFAAQILASPAQLPLPAQPPYVAADGVHFIYQQYEIAPYAAGMPECVLPFDAVAPLLKAPWPSRLPS